MASQANHSQLELLPQIDPDGHVSPNMRLSWRISPELKDFLEDQLIKRPFLLLSIVQGRNEVDRYIFPLTDNNQFIQFHHPGENTLLATVIWSSLPVRKLYHRLQLEEDPYILDWYHPQYEALAEEVGQKKSAYFEYRDRSDANQATVDQMWQEVSRLQDNLYRLEEDEFPIPSISSYVSMCERIETQATLTAWVDQEMFARPSWPITRYLGNRFQWWGPPAKDQCQLRQRAATSAFILPFFLAIKFIAVALLEMILLAVAGSHLLLGTRDLDFQPLAHPWNYEPSDIARHSKPSRWWTKEVQGQNEPRYELRHPIFFFINPPVGMTLLLVYASLLIANQGTKTAAAITLVLGVGILLLGGIISIVIAILANGQDMQKHTGSHAERQRQQQQLAKALEPLASANQASGLGISNLPPSRQTVRLIYQATKAKICKPFAR